LFFEVAKIHFFLNISNDKSKKMQKNINKKISFKYVFVMKKYYLCKM